MAWKWTAFLCVMGALCGATAFTSDEMAPGIRTSVVSSRYPERSRPVRVPIRTPEYGAPINFLPPNRDNDHENPDAIDSFRPVNPRRPDSSGSWSDSSNFDGEGRTQPGTPDDGRPTLPPLEVNIEEMNMNTKLTMSKITTVEAFARLMGVQLPPASGMIAPWRDSRNPSIAARFGGPDEEATVPPSAGCMPENQTVELKLHLEQQLNVMHFPTCVRLPRCGGCCGTQLLACRPTAVRPVQLKILRVEQTMPSGRSANNDIPEGRSRRRRPENSRTRRGTSSTYVMVDEEEHTACECLCRVQEQDCNPSTHVYVQNECQCACKNQDERSKCEEKPSTHHWDNDDCACYCLSPDTCSTGHFFDHISCSCAGLPVLGRSAAPLAAPRSNLTRRPAESAPVVFGSNWNLNNFDELQKQRPGHLGRAGA